MKVKARRLLSTHLLRDNPSSSDVFETMKNQLLFDLVENFKGGISGTITSNKEIDETVINIELNLLPSDDLYEIMSILNAIDIRINSLSSGVGYSSRITHVNILRIKEILTKTYDGRKLERPVRKPSHIPKHFGDFF